MWSVHAAFRFGDYETGELILRRCSASRVLSWCSCWCCRRRELVAA
jgi:hypothetical protein